MEENSNLIETDSTLALSLIITNSKRYEYKRA